MIGWTELLTVRCHSLTAYLPVFARKCVFSFSWILLPNDAFLAQSKAAFQEQLLLSQTCYTFSEIEHVFNFSIAQYILCLIDPMYVFKIMNFSLNNGEKSTSVWATWPESWMLVSLLGSEDYGKGTQLGKHWIESAVHHQWLGKTDIEWIKKSHTTHPYCTS